MNNIAIEVQNLSKLYRLGLLHRHLYSFRENLTNLIKQNREKVRRETIWALKDVTFEVKKGEVIGIIGRNGAGKTTLLKILSRITRPTEGYALLNGRTGSLLEVGTGFNPELTGRENIFLNGAILGMKKNEIKKKFDEIVDFAETEKFLDTPIKRYSSGMYVRLAFAVAAYLEPEILLVDEVLAVGDVAFQKKCLGKMEGVAKEGRTILFVSHNMATIQALCKRCILIESGKIVNDGPSSIVVSEYLDVKTEIGEVNLKKVSNRQGNGRARLTSLRLLDERNQVVGSIPMGHCLTIEFTFEVYDSALTSPSFDMSLRTTFGQLILRLTSRETHGVMPPTKKGGIVRLHIERLDLMPGTYYLNAGLLNIGEQVDLVERVLELGIAPYPVYRTGKLPPAHVQAIMFAPCSWEQNYE